MPPPRRQVLDELVELFLAEGFAHQSIGDLAARLRCSRSTLYLVAASKDEIVLAAVRAFFRRAAARIEHQVAADPDPGQRLVTYLEAVSVELRPASAKFHADLASYALAADIYETNTFLAARRVHELVAAGVEAGALRPVDARFVGAAVAEVMLAIQNDTIASASGLDDAAAYAALADLLLRGLGR